MAFRRDTENRNLPDSAELTEISVAGFGYVLRYETNSYDSSPFSDDISVNVDRQNHKDRVEVHFSEDMYKEVVDTVEEHMAADQEKQTEQINKKTKTSWL